MTEDLLTLDEAAVLLSVNRETIEMWLVEGLTHEQRDQVTLVRRSDLDAFLLQNGQGVVADPADSTD